MKDLPSNALVRFLMLVKNLAVSSTEVDIECALGTGLPAGREYCYFHEMILAIHELSYVSEPDYIRISHCTRHGKVGERHTREIVWNKQLCATSIIRN